MSEVRNIRINKVLGEFNISLDFAVDYLKDKGIVILSNPNTKISEDEYNILSKKFAGHKNNNATALEISEEKRKEKEALRLEKEIEEKLIAVEERNQEVIKAKALLSGPTQVGKIDLNPAKSVVKSETVNPKAETENPKTDEKIIRINKVLGEFNISLERAVKFLRDKGCVIEPNPNTKITQNEYKILAYQFDSKTENKISDDEYNQLIEKPKNEKLIKLDLYNNLNKDIYVEILTFLNTLSIDFFELKVNLINTETKGVVVEKTSKIEIVKGFANLKKSSNLLTYANTNTIFALCANELEVNFYGGRFLTPSKKIIGSIMYRFKESSFFKNNENIPENIYEKDLNTIISQLNPYECLALLIVSNKLKDSKIEKLKKAYTISEKTKKEFNEENPFEKDILETLKEDYANGIILKKISFENDFLESEFTDFQAFQICRGIKNKEHLYNKFDSNKHDDKDVFEAHYIAMKLLKDKGKNIINFILSIPPLPFKCNNFKILFSSLDKRRNQNENPVVRLKIKNHENATEEIEYSFLMEENTKYINQIRVRNKTTNTELFDVNRDGIVIPKENTRENGINKNITPILQLFYRITENENGLKEAIISYGIETGQCSICGRTLTDNSSKVKGIGPICEQYV